MKAFICDVCGKQSGNVENDQTSKEWFTFGITWPWKHGCSASCAHALVDDLDQKAQPKPAPTAEPATPPAVNGHD